MINPIYRFELDGVACSPVWGQDLAKSYELQAQEQFYRASLTSNLTFVSGDYAMIMAMPIDHQFSLSLYISYDRGQNWSLYWQGTFWKTDCDINEDDQRIIVKPSPKDVYSDVIAGMDREYNLIELAPEIARVKADRRPMMQIYVPGEHTIGCFLSGMWWEQECKEVEASDLGPTYHFGLKGNYRLVETSGDTYPPVPAVIAGNVPSTTNYSITQGDYRFEYNVTTYNSQWRELYMIYYQNVLSWSADIITNNPGVIPTTVILSPVASASGVLTINLRDVSIYGRLIADVPRVVDVLQPIPSDDIVEDNKNYHYCSPFTQFEIAFSPELSPVPTQWGMHQPGEYYQVPDFERSYFPVGRSMWSAVSIWVANRLWEPEEQYRAKFVVRDAYPLYSVISVLLGQIAPSITHFGSSDYSDFLYGQNAIRGNEQELILVPKSNIICSGYDQPAQKATITLRNVLGMLRDCYNCYWFIDESRRFRIEHIQYFRNGGSYSSSPSVGIDLTTQRVTRNNKSWSFAKNRYTFDKPEMPSRYQFSWMDSVTQQFEGYPIDILSSYVDRENVEQISVSRVTSDIDYILLNPGEIAMDGFVLLSADEVSGNADYQYELPYLNVQSVDSHGVPSTAILQNGYTAFVYLQRYYVYNLPAKRYEINGEPGIALGIKKLKKQDLSFPSVYEPDLLQLIKTDLGEGQIQKLSINLSSRQATVTLRYDTEQ